MKKLNNIFSAFVKKSLSSESLESALNELNLLLIGNDVSLPICSPFRDSPIFWHIKIVEF